MRRSAPTVEGDAAARASSTPRAAAIAPNAASMQTTWDALDDEYDKAPIDMQAVVARFARREAKDITP